MIGIDNWFNFSKWSLISDTICITKISSSNGSIFRVTGPLCWKFTRHPWIPSQWPVTGALMFPLIYALIKRLREQSWGWWFETSSRSLWRHCNENQITFKVYNQQSNSASTNRTSCRRALWLAAISISDVEECYADFRLKKRKSR